MIKKKPAWPFEISRIVQQRSEFTVFFHLKAKNQSLTIMPPPPCLLSSVFLLQLSMDARLSRRLLLTVGSWPLTWTESSEACRPPDSLRASWMSPPGDFRLFWASPAREKLFRVTNIWTFMKRTCCCWTRGREGEILVRIEGWWRRRAS